MTGLLIICLCDIKRNLAAGFGDQLPHSATKNSPNQDVRVDNQAFMLHRAADASS